MMIISTIIGNASSSSKKKGESTEDELIEDAKLLNVIKTKKQFLFKEIIISVIADSDSPFHVIFNVVVERPQDDNHQAHEADLPIIMDTLLTDLLPTLNLFQRDVNKELQASLEKRIYRVLKAKFDWITRIEIQNLRIQQINPNI